jgi:hypothetical protein
MWCCQRRPSRTALLEAELQRERSRSSLLERQLQDVQERRLPESIPYGGIPVANPPSPASAPASEAPPPSPAPAPAPEAPAPAAPAPPPKSKPSADSPVRMDLPNPVPPALHERYHLQRCFPCIALGQLRLCRWMRCSPLKYVATCGGRFLGSGSYGKVYAAVDTVDGTSVAIKCTQAVFRTTGDAIRALVRRKAATPHAAQLLSPQPQHTIDIPKGGLQSHPCKSTCATLVFVT